MTEITAKTHESTAGLSKVFTKAPQGFIAVRDIPAGAVITYLTGEILTTREMLRRVHRNESNVDDPHQISSDLYVMLDEQSRYFAHSCEPKAGVRGSNTLVAIADISEGQAICFDYSTVVGVSIFDNIWRMECACGAPACRGQIQSILSLPRLTLKKYAIADAIPDFIMEQITTQLGFSPDATIR